MPQKRRVRCAWSTSPTAAAIDAGELKQLETALEAGRTPQAGPEPLLTVEDVARLCP